MSNLSLLTGLKPSGFKSKLKKKLQAKPKSSVITTPYNFINVLEIVSKELNVPRHDILRRHDNGKLTRKRERVVARQLIMYFLKRNSHLTLKKIGEYFISNGRGLDHTTIIHASLNIEKLIDPTFGDHEFIQIFKSAEKKLNIQYDYYLETIYI